MQWLRDVVDDDAELRVVDQVADVHRPAGDEVIDADDAVPLGQEPLAQVRPDEPGPAGNKSAHSRFLKRIARDPPSRRCHTKRAAG